MASDFISKIKWHGDEFFKKLKEEEARNLERAAIFLKNEVKKNISEAPPASKAGEFPHREDGELRRSIAHEVDKNKMVARVGTNKVYGRYLELGTNEMAARPFLRPTLAKNRRTIRKLLTRKPNI